MLRRTLTTGRKGRKGFTLIELMVVIAIIAILAAILFPVFGRAKAKARATQCLSNFKQQNLAIQMYALDNDDYLPMAYVSAAYASGHKAPDGTVCERWWYPLSLDPYVKNLKIWACPDQSGDGLDIWDDPDYPEYLYYAPSHQASNRYGIAPDARGTGVPPAADPSQKQYGPVPMAMIEAPSSFLLTYDYPSYDGMAGHYFLHAQPQTVRESNMHNGGANCTFADGHVAWHKFDGYEAGWYTRERDWGDF